MSAVARRRRAGTCGNAASRETRLSTAASKPNGSQTRSQERQAEIAIGYLRRECPNQIDAEDRRDPGDDIKDEMPAKPANRAKVERSRRAPEPRNRDESDQNPDEPKAHGQSDADRMIGSVDLVIIHGRQTLHQSDHEQRPESNREGGEQSVTARHPVSLGTPQARHCPLAFDRRVTI